MKKICMLLLLLLSYVPLLGADQNELNAQDMERFKQSAEKLRCPTCAGLSVLESDAPFSVQIKDLVKEQIKLGKNDQEIVDFFVQRYGPWILRQPPKKGFGAFAWLLPIILLLGGPLCVWLMVFKRKIPAETFGARSLEEIVSEMQKALTAIKNKGA